MSETVPRRTVTRILDLLQARPPALPKSRLLCIDGHSGAGKTTLAGAVIAGWQERCPQRPAHLVPMDEVYLGWTGLAEADLRLHREVFAPLAAGRAGGYRRYDWHRQALAERRPVPAAELLVLEGVGSGSRHLDPYRTVLVWVDAPVDLRRRRGLARDGAAYEPHWQTWAAQEAAHFADHHTRRRADLLVDGTDGHLLSRP